MNEKPILFNAEMVCAILSGNKTQTRRLVKPQPPVDAYVNFAIDRAVFWVPATFVSESQLPLYDKEIMTPWAVDDLLWVRETWKPICHSTRTTETYICYKADGYRRSIEHTVKMDIPTRWRPSIHMPRWASRLTLCVKRVWVEQVQDITWQDARAEGVKDEYSHYGGDDDPWPVGGFVNLWDSIYAKKGYGWDTNPHVWACEFEVVNE